MTVRPLPMHIPLVARETLESYLTRLARANHLDLRDLRSHLGMRTPTRPPDLHRLATLTEHSLQRLTDVLADACPPPGRTRLSPLRGRPACRHCTLRRGIPTDVLCVAVDQRVCQRHRRWLGGPHRPRRRSTRSDRATQGHRCTATPPQPHPPPRRRAWSRRDQQRRGHHRQLERARSSQRRPTPLDRYQAERRQRLARRSGGRREPVRHGPLPGHRHPRDAARRPPLVRPRQRRSTSRPAPVRTRSRPQTPAAMHRIR
jgi:hypothetical protein